MKQVFKTVVSANEAREIINVWIKGDAECDLAVSRGIGKEIVITINYRKNTSNVENLKRCVSMWQKVDN